MKSDKPLTACRPCRPAQMMAALCRLALLELVPSAMEGDFVGFSDGPLIGSAHLAGSCFAAQQGGPFASPRRSRPGFRPWRTGRGWRSENVLWGPTIAALLPHQVAAADFVVRPCAAEGMNDVHVTIAVPNNRGATIKV